MKKIVHIYTLLTLICACEGNVDFVPSQEGNNAGTSPGTTDDKKTAENKNNSGTGTTEGSTTETLEGIEVLDKEGAPKEIVFGCEKQNLIDDTKITICLQNEIDPEIKPNIKNTIKADINSDALWDKLKDNFYTKITLDNVPAHNLMPKLFENILKKLVQGGKLEIIGLPHYMLYDNKEPKQILFWQSDSNFGDRLSLNYFNTNKLPADWYDWSIQQDFINSGAPYTILESGLYLECASKGTSSYRFLNSDTDAKARSTEAYNKAMAPFKKANDMFWGNWLSRWWKKFTRKPLRKDGGETQKMSLSYFTGCLSKLEFVSIGKDSIVFVKPINKITQEPGKSAEKDSKQATLKK